MFRETLRNEEGITYLLAIDPYFWNRHAKNIIEKGHPYDYIKDGKTWNEFSLYPGREMGSDCQ